jgi:hypothetical protein
MAKRVRGSTSRPGQRPPLQRTAARPAAKPTAAKPTTGTTQVVARPPDELTDAEEARAAELEAAIVAEEREAEASKRRARVARSAEPVGVTRSGSTLAVSAAEEYAYVARDIRRLTIVGGSLIGVLVGLWAIVQVTGFQAF